MPKHKDKTSLRKRSPKRATTTGKLETLYEEHESTSITSESAGPSSTNTPVTTHLTRINSAAPGTNAGMTETEENQTTSMRTVVSYKASLIQQYINALLGLLEAVQQESALQYLRKLHDREVTGGDGTYFGVLVRAGTFLNDESAHTCDNATIERWRPTPIGSHILLPQFLSLSGISRQQYSDLDSSRLRINMHCAFYSLFQDVQRRNPERNYKIPNPLLIEELVTTLNEACVGRFFSEVSREVASDINALSFEKREQARRNLQKIVVTCTSPDKITVTATHIIPQPDLEVSVEAQISYDVTAVNGLISYQNVSAKVTLPVAPELFTELQQRNRENASSSFQQAPTVTYQDGKLTLGTILKGGVFTAKSMLEVVPEIVIPETRATAQQETRGTVNRRDTSASTRPSHSEPLLIIPGITPERSQNQAPIKTGVSNTKNSSATVSISPSLSNDASITPVKTNVHASTASPKIQHSQTVSQNPAEDTCAPEEQLESIDSSMYEESTYSRKEQVNTGTIWAKIRNFFASVFRGIRRFFNSVMMCCTQHKDQDVEKSICAEQSPSVQAPLLRENNSLSTSYSVPDTETIPNSHTSPVDVRCVVSPPTKSQSR